MKIGIIGNGFVGKATRLLECIEIKCLTYDINPISCNPLGTTLNDIKQCDVIFVAVPTPMNENGDCHLDIVKSVVSQLDSHPCIVVRSTLPIGTAKNLGCYFMPEFLTEKNWANDFFNTSYWIFGGKDDNFITKISSLFDIAYRHNCISSNKLVFLTTTEAESIKYFRNSFLATKVAFCNEFYQLCQKLDIDYETVAKYACLDERIGSSHTSVPGHDNRFGFGGTCLPKDITCLRNQMRQAGSNFTILSAIIDRNNKIDRPEKDWQQDIGRAFISNTPRILITGGAGFIGNNLSRHLLSLGERVLVVDNFISSEKENIVDLLSNPNYTLIKCDILEIPELLNLKRIYHLACPASPPKYQANPIHTIKTCVNGTINVLELARLNKCPILFSSTSEVYGEPFVSPQPESYRGNVNTVGIRSCYDEGKRMAETLMFEYKNQYNMDCKIVRIFNTFGPYMNPDDGRVVTNFIKQAKNNDNITIYGDGSQTRSFCYIDDLVRGLILMMSSKECGPINLGNPNEQTVLELAHHIIRLTQSESKIVFMPLPGDDPTNRCPDITLAKTLLKWEPIVNIEIGLLKTINVNVEKCR